MYKIEVRSSGFIFTFAGVVEAKEMKQWHDEAISKLTDFDTSQEFGAIINMSKLQPLSPEAQGFVEKIQKTFKEAGLKRTAVILPNVIIEMQFTRIAKQSGIYENERYFNDESPNAIENAIQWVKHGIDTRQEQ